MKPSRIRSPLAKARGWGSAHDGTSHFLWQRITAIALIPLTFWFLGALGNLAAGGDLTQVAAWFGSSAHAVGMVIFLMALFYHAALGLQVIIEDYLHNPWLKLPKLLLSHFAMFVLAAVSIIAVLKLHLQGVAG